MIPVRAPRLGKDGIAVECHVCGADMRRRSGNANHALAVQGMERVRFVTALACRRSRMLRDIPANACCFQPVGGHADCEFGEALLRCGPRHLAPRLPVVDCLAAPRAGFAVTRAEFLG